MAENKNKQQTETPLQYQHAQYTLHTTITAQPALNVTLSPMSIFNFVNIFGQGAQTQRIIISFKHKSIAFSSPSHITLTENPVQILIGHIK